MASGPARPMVPFQHSSADVSVGPERQGTTNGTSKGKAYTLTVDQADSSGEVVTGIIFVHSTSAYVLFDFGSTHCFISSQFISKQNISCNTVYWVGKIALEWSNVV